MMPKRMAQRCKLELDQKGDWFQDFEGILGRNLVSSVIFHFLSRQPFVTRGGSGHFRATLCGLAGADSRIRTPEVFETHWRACTSTLYAQHSTFSAFLATLQEITSERRIVSGMFGLFRDRKTERPRPESAPPSRRSRGIWRF